MKTLLTLLLALLSFSCLFAQSSLVASASGGSKALSLSHEDSLVLSAAMDTLAVMDSLSRRDSLSRARTRVMPFPGAINAILQDFPHNLRNITGELVLAQGEWENYSSMVLLPGAESCIVTRYHSADDTTVSWQARMLQTDEFEKASQTYHELFKKLQGCYLKLVDGSVIDLIGKWEPAKEDAHFTTSTLRLTTGDWRYKDLKIEVELVYLLADWAVNINIVTKKRDDEIGNGRVGVTTD